MQKYLLLPTEKDDRTIHYSYGLSSRFSETESLRAPGLLLIEY